MGGRAVDVGTRRMQRRVLGLLLLHLNAPLTVERMIDLLWGADAPGSARGALQVHVSRLRSVLAAEHADRHGVRLLTATGGYLLEGAPELVDAHRFRSLCGRAREADDPATRGRLLGEALDLWSGPPLGDLATERIRCEHLAGWEDLRVSAVEWRAEAALAVGDPSGVLAELAAVRAGHPSRERLVELHMLALYRSGARAEALAEFERARDRLAEETGLDPRAELAELHARILRSDPTLDLRVEPAPTGPAPAQLPPVHYDFVGRDDELGHLDALLTGRDAAAGAVVISTIAGVGGIGKTALAVHWSHRVRDRFPDGQIYLNLQGYSAAAPLRPIDALVRVLTAFGVKGDKVPTEVEEATDLYRSVVADKRVLVVLDNAATAEQVRPLLPSNAGSLALVTSRDRLSSLIAKGGATRLTLGILPLDRSLELLARVIGADRAAAEPAASARLVALCGHLPLAIRITAALLLEQPDKSITAHADELAATDRLTALGIADDEQASVRAAFDQSYRGLTGEQAGLFRLLGLFPGEDVTSDGAASLAGTSPAEARALLDRLAAGHLVETTGSGRYTMHDLLAEYARNLCAAQDPPEARSAALVRLFDFYLSTSAAAMDQLHPGDSRSGLSGSVPPFPDQGTAAAWLDAERVSLLAMAGHDPAGDLARPTIELAELLFRYSDDRGHYNDGLTLHSHALTAARALGDDDALRGAHNLLGVAYMRLSRYERALEHLGEALSLVAPDDPIAEAPVCNNIGIIYFRLGRYEDAQTYLRRAYEGHRAMDAQLNAVRSASNLAVVLGRLGRYHEALGHLRDTLDYHVSAGNRDREGLTLDNLAYFECRIGEYERATEHHLRALAIFQEMGNRLMEVNVLANLAVVLGRQGRHAEAVAHLEKALAHRREIGARAAEGAGLTALGTVYHLWGRPDEAREQFQRALSLGRDIGEPSLVTEAMIGLGLAECRLGRPAEAVQHHREALESARRTGERYLEAGALAGLGAAYVALGDRDTAREYRREALALYTAMGLPEAAEIRRLVS